MPDATPCSRSWGLPARTTLMRPTSARLHRPRDRLERRGWRGRAGADRRDRPAVDRNIDGPGGGLELPPSSHRNGRARGAAKPASPPVLLPDQSAVLRDRLLVEIATLPSEDSATDWAQRALAAKNQLSCWRLPSNCDCPRSCRPNAPGRPSAVDLGVHLRLPAMTRWERAPVRMMSVMISQLASTKVR